MLAKREWDPLPLPSWANSQGTHRGGADSDEFKVSWPQWAYSDEQWAIHFPTEEQLDKFKSTFWGEVKSGRQRDLQHAGHTLHAIEDGHGAHRQYINKTLGHFWGNFFGDDPDVNIGDPSFRSVADEVYKFLKRGPNARLTPDQIERLMVAILRKCGKERSKKLNLKGYLKPGDSGFGGDPGPRGFAGNPFGWNWNIFRSVGVVISARSPLSP